MSLDSRGNSISSSTADFPMLEFEWFPEPELEFARNQRHINPKIGISLFGPKSLHTPRHREQVHVGFIGEPEGVEGVQRFLDSCSPGVAATNIGNASVPFPGISDELGYRISLSFSPALIEKITKSEIEAVFSLRSEKESFTRYLELIEGKVSLLCERDHPLDYIFVVFSEEIFNRIRVSDMLDPVSGKAPVVRDFRRALKARLMKYKKPTQLIRESTVGIHVGPRLLEDSATCAWNLLNGLYFKVGGLPWGPIGLCPSTCFVGISFYRPFGEPGNIQASMAQAFDENGEGLVLRGQKFRWDPNVSKSPHLSEPMAHRLISEVVTRFRSERGNSPKRVVIHKSSRFSPEEKSGFVSALKGISEFDLVSVNLSGDLRVLRAGSYPPLRGTVLHLGNVHLLYSTGFIPQIGKFPHGHVPTPLRITDHFGDTEKGQLLSELFILTKMNWNTANVDGSLPITLQFSRLVGEILREIPESEVPDPKYCYYI